MQRLPVFRWKEVGDLAYEQARRDAPDDGKVARTETK
jgi:hypothetical protein